MSEYRNGQLYFKARRKRAIGHGAGLLSVLQDPLNVRAKVEANRGIRRARKAEQLRVHRRKWVRGEHE